LAEVAHSVLERFVRFGKSILDDDKVVPVRVVTIPNLSDRRGKWMFFVALTHKTLTYSGIGKKRNRVQSS
jgi:hypothetical protein